MAIVQEDIHIISHWIKPVVKYMTSSYIMSSTMLTASVACRIIGFLDMSLMVLRGM
jgi:hypothetical protein